MKTNSSNAEQHNFKQENSHLKKENAYLKQEIQILQSQNELLQNKLDKLGQRSNNIHGFCIVKQQGKYLAAAKRMDGKIHRVYIGKTTDDAKQKIHAYLEKIGYFKKLDKAKKLSEQPVKQTATEPISGKQSKAKNSPVLPAKKAQTKQVKPAQKEKAQPSQAKKSQPKQVKTTVNTRLSKAK